MKKFKEGVKKEFNKITWLKKEDITKQTAVVVVSTICIGLIIVFLDFVIEYGLNFVIG